MADDAHDSTTALTKQIERMGRELGEAKAATAAAEARVAALAKLRRRDK